MEGRPLSDLGPLRHPAPIEGPTAANGGDQRSVLEVVEPVPEVVVDVAVGLTPIKTPEAGNGNGLLFGVETTPADDSPEVFRTTRSCSNRLRGAWSWLILPNGSITTPR